jgi:RNA polymerase sigma factor (sigma-70 family)
MKLTKQEEEALYIEHQEYIAKIVERSLKSNETFRYMKEELEQVGALAFVEAARSYDPGRETKFTSWLFLKVQGAVADRIRKESKIKKTEGDYAEEMMHLSNGVYEIDRFDELLNAGELTENQMDILRLRYFWGCTQQETADKLQVTQQAVDRAEKRALSSLRFSLED